MSGSAGVTEAVPDDWVQPAINVHAIITRKRKIPEYLIHKIFFGKGIRLLAVARHRYRIVQPAWDPDNVPAISTCGYGPADYRVQYLQEHYSGICGQRILDQKIKKIFVGAPLS